MNTQDVRTAGKGFVYRNPQDGEIYEAPGDMPLNWDQGYPEGIEAGTAESQNYDAHRAKFQSLPNYAFSRDYLDDQISKKENSQFDDPLWIGASRILYDYINKQPGRNKHGRNKEIKPQPAKPLDSGYSYADWGVNFMLKFNYNLPNMVYQASRVAEMPPDVAKAMYYLMETADRDGVSAYNTGMGIAHAAWDATNYIGLATFGIGVAGSQAGKQATKAGIKGILKEIVLSNVTKASVATGVEGAVFAAADDLARQTVQIAGDENKSGFDLAQTGTSAAIGATVGEELTRMGAPAVSMAGEAIRKGVTNLRNKAPEANTEPDTSPPMDESQSIGSGALRENVPMNEIDELGFYSELLSVARVLPPKIATDDAISILRKKSGVKEDELKWVGIDEFVELQKAQGNKSFDRQELVDFIRNNQVKLTEVRRDGPDANDPFAEDMMFGRTSITPLSWNDVTNSRMMQDYEQDAEMYFDEGRFDLESDGERFIQFVKFKYKNDNNVVETKVGEQSPDDALATRLINKLNEYEEKGVPMQEVAYGGTFDGELLDAELQEYLQAFAMDQLRQGYEAEPQFIIGSVDPDMTRNRGYVDTQPDGYYAIGNSDIGYYVQIGDYRADAQQRMMSQQLGDRGIRDEIAVQQYINELNENEGYLDTNYKDRSATLFGEYTLDGLGDDNYQEITLTFANPDQIKAKQPSSNQGIYQGSHFNDGEVVHIRKTSRTMYYPESAQKGDANINTFYDESGEYTGPVGPNDQIVIYAPDEIQSDWAQRAQYGKGLASEENLTKWASSNKEAVEGIRTALNTGIVNDLFDSYQIGSMRGIDDGIRKEITEGIDFMFDQAEADTGQMAYFLPSLPQALSEIYGLKPAMDARKLATELVGNFNRVMDTMLVDQSNRFNPTGRRTKLDLMLAQDTKSVDIGTFNSIYEGFVISRPGMPRLSADEYALLPDAARIANLLRFEGKQLTATDSTPLSRNKAEEAILYWRENGKLPEGFALGVDKDVTTFQNTDFGSGLGDFAEIMNKIQQQGNSPELVNEIFENAVTLDEKEFMGRMVKLHESIASQEEGFEPPSWSVDDASDKYGIAKQLAEIFMLDLYSRLRTQLKGSAPKETYAIANKKPTMPDSPFVKGGKDFSALALKRIMADAVATGHDAISLPSHELLTSIPGIGLQSDKLYDTIIPKEINKLIEGTDAKIERVPAARMFLNDTDFSGNMRGQGSSVLDWDERVNPEGMYFNLIRITPQLRDRIRKGFALFSAIPLAMTGTSYMNEERGSNVNTTY